MKIYGWKALFARLWLTQGSGIGVAIYMNPHFPLQVNYTSTDLDGHRVLFKFSQIDKR